MAFRINVFCCGLSLRTGSITAAIFHTVFGLVGAVLSFVMAFSYVPNVADLSTLHIMFIAVAMISLVEIFVSALLIHATLKNNRGLVNLWLITNTIIVLTYFTILVVVLMTEAEMQNAQITVFCFVGCLLLVLMLYFLVVVFSYKESISTAGHVISYPADNQYQARAAGTFPVELAYPHNYPARYPPPDQPTPYFTEVSRSPPPYRP